MVTDVQRRLLSAKVQGRALTGRALRAFGMRELAKLEGYAWAGVYRLEGDKLVLDEFVGTPTEHIEIPVGRGVCGTAVAQGRNQIVADVSLLDNYLSCSTETKSEIVVLIRDGAGALLGQIDVDGHTAGSFDATDEALLGELAAILAEHWD